MSSLKYSPAQVKDFPGKPGVYKFFNEEDKIIYVGKAKDLKKRVQSYFNKLSGSNWKTRRMVSEIKSIEFILVDTELDALHLENSLIKDNQPKYNIRLKDDKSYPFICITDERFPRIISTRRFRKIPGAYYGPYASVKAMNNVIRLINSLYQLRTCRFDLSEENIAAGKFKVCLEYHIKNCQGPCEGLQDEEDYMQDIAQAKNIIQGNLAEVRRYFKDRMAAYAGKMEYELAEKFRSKLELLEKYQSKTLIVNPNISDLDVFTLLRDKKRIFINFLKVVKGAIQQSYTTEVKAGLEENEEDILSQSIVELKKRFMSDSEELVTNIALTELPLYKSQNVPQRGDKKHLLELSLKNLLFYKKERMNQVKETSRQRVLKKLQEDLRLTTLPIQIECFDNSNIQGTNPVASLVSFKNGRPFKKDYRHFHIKTVVGANDFASMKEIVKRRYSRLKKENQRLPDLVVIDGGKGQLNAAKEALEELDLYGKIPLIGIAKRLEEIYFPEDQYPIHLEKKSESLKLIQQIRDEAHRFAITFHRNVRNKKSFKTILDDIEGIGPKTKEKLLRKYRTLSKIRDADKNELVDLIGQSKSKIILSALTD